MAGHDFMDFKDGVGGSDGCTDMAHPDNAGLPECLHLGEFGISIKDAYVDHCTTVSVADFLVITAQTVMTISRAHVTNEDSSAAALDFKPSFKWGRTTSMTCPGSAHLLPNPEDGCAANERVFVNNLGLSWRETAALMGVHTLGRAHPANSGYVGWWSDAPNQRKFNNDYFFSIVHKGWMPEKAVLGNAAKNQWTRSDFQASSDVTHREMMLDTDMCLFFNNQRSPRFGSNTRAATCNGCTWWGHGQSKLFGSAGGKNAQRRAACEHGPQQLFDSSTNTQDCGVIHISGADGGAVNEFAKNEVAWLETFKDAWYKVTELGFDSLQSLGTCADDLVFIE